MKAGMPSWLQRLTGYSSHCYFLEDAIIDPKNNKMELNGKNLSFSQFVEMKEKCTYTSHAENKEWTQFKQEGVVTAYTFGISKKIEEFCVQTFERNASKGRELMEQTLLKVKQETEVKLAAVEEFGSRIKEETERCATSGLLAILPSTNQM